MSVVPALVASAGSVEGLMSGGGFEQDPLRTGYLFGDFDLIAAEGAWRLSLGMFGVVGRLHETYADVSYDTGKVRTSLGFPRPAYDGVAASALTDIMPRLALESIGISRSRATYGTMYQSDYLPFGAVIAGETGALAYAVSLHGVPDYGTVIAGSGVSFGQGNWRFDLGAEAVDQDDRLDWNTKGQVVLVQDRLTLALGAYHPAANAQPDALELSARYDLTSQLQVTALTRQIRADEATQAIGARYRVTDALAFDLGITETGNPDKAVSVAVRYAF